MSLVSKQKKLERYVQRYFERHPEVKLVGIAGSIGKTYTKTAIATVLAERYRVRLFHGNRGTNFTAPLAILGIDYPGDIKGIFAWHKVFRAARQRIKQPTDVDIIIQEMNSTGPGTMLQYGAYIRPDLSVASTVSPSNIEVFGSLNAMAEEQLTAVNISRSGLINRDDIDGQYAVYLSNAVINTYGTGGSAEYRFLQEDFSIDRGYKGKFVAPEWQESLPVDVNARDELSLRQVVAAMAVGVRFGLAPADIARGVAKIHPMNGRMNILRGNEESMIIDDTSNNSPLGSTIALRTLYGVQAPQRIAVFGAMAHLGQTSPEYHRELGELCDATQLSWVVTVGADANTYLAPAARGRGCQVKECATALEAGAFVNGLLEKDSVVMFSGPEDGVYLEEAVRIVLHSASDEAMLVRQSPEWRQKKDAFFSRFS